MAGSSEFEFDDMGIANVYARDGRTLKIPPHQRDYSWTKAEVDTLLEDINAGFEEDEDYFLGTIVSIRNGTKKQLEIVDGQQRLTTIYLLISSIASMLTAYLSNKEDTKAENLRDHLVGAKLNFLDADEGKIPSLVLNVDDNDFFKRLISHNNKNDLFPVRESHKLLISALHSINTYLRNNFQTSDRPDLKRIQRFRTYLEEKAKIILLATDDASRAFRMFETLNDRGLRTTQADLVKNYFFSQVGETKIQEAQSNWSQIQSNLNELGGSNQLLIFLRHYLGATRAFVREKDIYTECSKVKGSVKSSEFLSNITGDSKIYVDTFQTNSKYWIDYPNSVKIALDEINIVNIKPLRPLIFAIAKKMCKKEANLSLQFIANLGFRLLVTGDTRSQTNEKAYADLANKVYLSETILATDIKSGLRRFIPNDSDFERSFSIWSTNSSKIARYILKKLENVKAGTENREFEINPDTDILNLEHVLDRNPDFKIWSHFDAENAGIYKSRIGNMCLLRKSHNSSLAGNSYSEKCQAYKTSTLQITNEITKFSCWSPETIQARQKELAELAKTAWTI